MSKFLYHGPSHGLTLAVMVVPKPTPENPTPAPERQELEVQLVDGQEVELPEENEHVCTLVELKRLIPVEDGQQPAAKGETSPSVLTPPQVKVAATAGGLTPEVVSEIKTKILGNTDQPPEAPPEADKKPAKGGN